MEGLCARSLLARPRSEQSVAESDVMMQEAAIDRAKAVLANTRAGLAAARAQESLVGAREIGLRMAEAQLLTALARVERHKAALHNSEFDLEHTIIRSPVGASGVSATAAVPQCGGRASGCFTKIGRRSRSASVSATATAASPKCDPEPALVLFSIM